ncbi:helix-turn-helix domain-containing protein [Faecalicatena contorta]|uniref:Helix-turn-helix n=1 Tax=Faecalicatena contorta TaxID=39482 RepID=A0A316A2G8_9FIRM|nr:helix-turn-helix transcriptional regulator [Faecalicatena contorta]PWJ52051.1 helix-turn-helix protein [Faecalicatena contorta]SUQ12329.1 Helix-turn-helix [Faecalicatena contorta]
MNIQSIIKNRRFKFDLTMKNIAKALSISVTTVPRYECGNIRDIEIDKFDALANVLRCSVGYLVHDFGYIKLDAEKMT